MMDPPAPFFSNTLGCPLRFRSTVGSNGGGGRFLGRLLLRLWLGKQWKKGVFIIYLIIVREVDFSED